MLEVVIVGAGNMARTHANGYAGLPNARLAGVFDIRADAAAGLADLHGATGYSDFDAMLADLTPDIVDVCVPTPFHADYVCRAAAAGGISGIVTEKPMARTLQDCDRMASACEKAGIPLFVAQVVRFFPEFAAAREKVLAGAVGRPASVRTRRGGGFPRAWENWYSRLDWSGGAVLDLIIHDFDWLRWTFGEVERVYAKGMVAGLPEDAQVDKDYALVTLRFKSGVIGHVEGTWADPGGFKVSLEVAGDEGLLEYNFNQPAHAPLQIAKSSRETGESGVAVPESPTATNPYQAELAHFVDCLESGIAPSIAPLDGREAVRIALAAIESIKTGRTVRMV